MIERPQQAASKVDGYPCVVCGKRIARPRWMVHLHKGGSHIVTAAEAAELNAAGHEGGDMGAYPLGTDCLRRHPRLKPYAVGREACDAAHTSEGGALSPGEWRAYVRAWGGVLALAHACGRIMQEWRRHAPQSP